MPVLERDVVLMGKDGDNQTIDLPITCLKNVEDTADVKAAPTAEDYLPIVDSADGGQMKKTPLGVILGPLGEAKAAAEAAATMEQVNAAIQTAVLDSWEGSY